MEETGSEFGGPSKRKDVQPYHRERYRTIVMDNPTTARRPESRLPTKNGEIV
jgi:hypothetical protein